jgi:hypothetical protein
MAVDGADHRPREGVPAGEQAVDPDDHRSLVVRAEHRSQLQVHAGAEEPGPPRQYDGTRRVGAEFLQRRVTVLEQPDVHRIGRRPVDVDDGHLSFAIDADVAHAWAGRILWLASQSASHAAQEGQQL